MVQALAEVDRQEQLPTWRRGRSRSPLQGYVHKMGDTDSLISGRESAQLAEATMVLRSILAAMDVLNH